MPNLAVRGPRKSLQLPLHVWGEDDQGTVFCEHTHTSDVSANGVAFSSPPRIDVGTRLHLRIEIPVSLRHHFAEGPTFAVDAEGTGTYVIDGIVCRVERLPHWPAWRVGARLLPLGLRRPEGAGAEREKRPGDPGGEPAMRSKSVRSSAEWRAQLRSMLEERRRDLDVQRQRLGTEPALEKDEPIDPLDRAAMETAREVHDFLATQIVGLRARIDDAIERVDRGAAGSCLACGAAISDERLAAVPFAELCCACQAAEEARATATTVRTYAEEWL